MVNPAAAFTIVNFELPMTEEVPIKTSSPFPSFNPRLPSACKVNSAPPVPAYEITKFELSLAFEKYWFTILSNWFLNLKPCFTSPLTPWICKSAPGSSVAIPTLPELSFTNKVAIPTFTLPLTSSTLVESLKVKLALAPTFPSSLYSISVSDPGATMVPSMFVAWIVCAVTIPTAKTRVLVCSELSILDAIGLVVPMPTWPSDVMRSLSVPAVSTENVSVSGNLIAVLVFPLCSILSSVVSIVPKTLSQALLVSPSVETLAEDWGTICPWFLILTIGRIK